METKEDRMERSEYFNKLKDLSREEIIEKCMEDITKKQAMIDFFQGELDEYREHFIKMRKFYRDNPDKIGSGTLESSMQDNLVWYINELSNMQNMMNDIINFNYDEDEDKDD